MASDDVKTLDPGSLDAIRAELVEAGFEPYGGSPRRWEGPIAEPLQALTSAETMRIVFRDGWPYRPPTLFVEGITSDHAVTDGELCLFQPGDDSMSWVTLGGLQARIGEWVRYHATGFRPEDAMLDAHLYFANKSATLATLDIASLKIREDGDEAGRTGQLYGEVHETRDVIQLSPRRPKGRSLGGRWYYHGKLVEAPPRDIKTFREALTKGQQANFDRRVKNIRRGGGPMVFTLLWETRYGGRNALVIVASLGQGEEVEAEALELAPTDMATLQLRAGPDVQILTDKKVVIFGVGSIGSNVAARLSEAGVGTLKLIDGDKLRPGNVVRHAADFGVGNSKALVTEIQIKASAPWTKVERALESPWSPARISQLLSDADLAVEATGIATFAELLSRVALDDRVPLVSAALYRSGYVGRVRRQRTTVDTPFAERLDEAKFPLIPPGDEPVSLEAGCSSPVNNASPVAVAAIAATTADLAIDLLSKRLDYPEEVIDVYRPLDVEPFTSIGRLSER